MKIILHLCSELKIINHFLLVYPNPKPKPHVLTHGHLYFILNFILSFQLELDKDKNQFLPVQLFPEGVRA